MNLRHSEAAELASASSTTAHSSEVLAKVQTVLTDFGLEHRLPGATAAYILADGEVGSVATGLANVETDTLMTPASRMLAASVGKTFVGAAVVALSHEGQLDLDDPISKWLGDQPWFDRLPNHATITVRQLLNHSSGLPDHIHDPDFATAVRERWREEKNPFPPESLVAFILDQSPLFEAGQKWAYTDTGYILIGMIVEVVVGRSFFEELQERFLDPLGLSQTSPSDRRDLPGLATGYLAANNPLGFPTETTTSPGVMKWNPAFEWTGGGLVSTSHDLAAWGKALFEGKVMDGAYLDDLLAAVSVGADVPGVEYGAGIGIYRNGPFGPVYGHSGWIPGYSSCLGYYPDHHTAIAFQVNTDMESIATMTQMVQKLERALAETIIGTPD